MTGRGIAAYVSSLALFTTGLWLMSSVNWRIALGVFLFVWGNNIIYSYRLKLLMLSNQGIHL